ncbi:MAG TPA: 3-keto-5-aminohexanoate cleavage protein [Eoetvoesiella sp.]
MQKTIITCAVTGNITQPDQHPNLPVTPQQIAEAALEAEKAGAAAVHIHVRDPETGRPSMELRYYQEVVERIRAASQALIINLTTGPGGRFVPSDGDPKVAAAGTNLMHPEPRVEHVRVLQPDICSLDLNTMFSGTSVVINTPSSVERMAKIINDAGVKAEIEIFDSGDIHLANDLIAKGILKTPALFSFVLGVKYGFNASPQTVAYAKSLIPAGSAFTAFGIGRSEFPMVAQSVLYGGHVRVGFEDNLYLSKGVLAPSNASLVEKAKQIVELLGGQVACAKEAREILGL